MTDLTQRQADLYRAVVARSGAVAEQMMLITVLARTVGASEADVRAVRDLILGPHIRECRS